MHFTELKPKAILKCSNFRLYCNYVNYVIFQITCHFAFSIIAAVGAAVLFALCVVSAILSTRYHNVSYIEKMTLYYYFLGIIQVFVCSVFFHLAQYRDLTVAQTFLLP